MRSPGIVSTLAEQLVEATRRVTWANAKGEDSRTMEAVVQSLRQTLACLVQLKSPRELGPEAFILHVDGEGFLDVRRAGKTTPLRGAHVRHFFEEAGALLHPGQEIVLGPRLVRLAAEEALAEIGAEEARVRDEKLRLIDVSLTTHVLETGRAPKTPKASSEAA